MASKKKTQFRSYKKPSLKREPGSTKSKGPARKKPAPMTPAPDPKKKAEAQRPGSKKVDAKVDAKQVDAKKVDAKKVDAKKVEAKKPDAKKVEAKNVVDAKKPEQKKPEQKKKPAPPPKKAEPVGPTRCGTVALVGRPNVGKSSLLNALLGQKIAATTHKPQTTRKALRGVYTEGNTQIVFVDTPGLHDAKGGLFSYMLNEAKDTAAGVDVLCFLVEADGKGGGVAPVDEAALKTLEGKIAGKPSILIINKIDILSDKASLLPVLSAWATKADFTALIPVSAHKKDGLRPLIDELAKHLPLAPFAFPVDSLTDQSERDIAAELIREKVMLELQQEIPYRAAVVVESFDESRRDDPRKPLVTIMAQIVVEKDSQKAMVIGAGGQRIKTIGQRARLELQHLLGCQVHLELFVRVEEKWTETAGGLHKLGYTRTSK